MTFCIPVTSHFIEILRRTVLRGAGLTDLMPPPVVGLSLCCVAVLALSLARFQKRVA